MKETRTLTVSTPLLEPTSPFAADIRIDGFRSAYANQVIDKDELSQAHSNHSVCIQPAPLRMGVDLVF